MGAYALDANTTANSNTAFGYGSLSACTTGGDNNALGFHAAVNITTGSDNVAIGNNALYSLTTTTRNIAIGKNALYACTSTQNVAVGYGALDAMTTGSESVAIGDHAGTSSTGSHNTFIGHSAGGAATTGSDSVFIGSMAGDHDTSTTDGDRATIVGSRANASTSGSSQEAVYGYNVTGKGSNTFMVGGTSGAYNSANSSTWSTTSDIRIKKNINDNATGLDKINQIQVKNFEYKTEDEIKTDSPELTDVVKSAVVHKEGVQVGSIAQEIEKVLPEVVVTNEHGVKSVNESPLTWYMINAIKELSAEVEQLKSQLNN
jgi:hypothetical protein